MVDLQLDRSTAELHARLIKHFLTEIKKPARAVTKEDLRQYLKLIKENMASWTYKNTLSSLKRFYRDFLGIQDLVNSFKFPRPPFKPKIVPKKVQLQAFYRALTSSREKALFLVYATSGLRHSEALSLNRFGDIDFEKRMLKPIKAENQSKHVWLSFYNSEAEKALEEYLSSRKDSDPRLFPVSKRHVLRIFKKATEATGIRVTPQVLREWFCSEMGELGIPDRYIDAFCGRVPRSILARHYTDYSPEKLKRIYDKADIKMLN